jgi:hypothetical protein
MTFSKFKRLFRTRRNGDGGPIVGAFWVAAKEQAALIDPESGRVFAYVEHDGYGKYHPTVLVSPWRAFQLVTREASQLVSLRAFPRLTVELCRLKTETIAEAQLEVEHYLRAGD